MIATDEILAGCGHAGEGRVCWDCYRAVVIRAFKAGAADEREQNAKKADAVAAKLRRGGRRAVAEKIAEEIRAGRLGSGP